MRIHAYLLVHLWGQTRLGISLAELKDAMKSLEPLLSQGTIKRTCADHSKFKSANGLKRSRPTAFLDMVVSQNESIPT